MKKVAIIDYGLANLRSVSNAFACFNADVQIVQDGRGLDSVDAIVLPGVGSFTAGMRELYERGHVSALKSAVFDDGVPFLGICLGMQFLFEGSDEGAESGLGWLPGRCRRLPASKVKVPHMGWNEVSLKGNGHIMRGLRSPSDFYFVHSFYVPRNENLDGITTGTCDHGGSFVASVSQNNIHAVQFHPEKSQSAGMKLIENFLAL